MHEVWTTPRIRAAEDAVLARTRPGALMRRAAFAVAVQASRMMGRTAGRRVVLLVGAGNNGGDALFAGAALRRRGARVDAVLLVPERAHAAGLQALKRAGGRVHKCAEGAVQPGNRAERALRHGYDTEGTLQLVREADLMIDGIVGLSAKGPLRPAAAELVEAAQAPVLAVDIPSGVDPDTGAVDGPAVAAAATVTFGARKPAHLLAPGATRCGELVEVDIGLRPELGDPDIVQFEAADVARTWPVPEPEDDKYTQGVTGIAAGSGAYPGAAVLAAGGAVQATSGMVRYAGSAADAVRSHWPEVVATGSLADAGRVQAWVVGPGLGTGRDAADTVEQILASGVPVCADADAITLLAEHSSLKDARDPSTPLVLTPHAGEFQRLAGDIGDDRVDAVRRAAEDHNATVLLKGHSTVIAGPDGRVAVNYSGRAWPATAGSGDVLSGIVGALMAAGVESLTAAASAAYVHDLAAAFAAGQLTSTNGAPAGASAIVASIGRAIRHVRREFTARHQDSRRSKTWVPL